MDRKRQREEDEEEEQVRAAKARSQVGDCVPGSSGDGGKRNAEEQGGRE